MRRRCEKLNKVLIGKRSGQRTLWRPRHRLGDNIEVDLKKQGADWTHLARDRSQRRELVNMVTNVQDVFNPMKPKLV
jgi:hypothetical protein